MSSMRRCGAGWKTAVRSSLAAVWIVREITAGLQRRCWSRRIWIAVTVPVSLGGETAPGEQTEEIQAECVDVNLKNGSTLLAGEVFPLLSHTNCKQGRIVAAAFSMDAISDLCLTNPSSFEKLYTAGAGK
ncbi:MAG: hypothetical protein ACLR8P_10715 [Clostridium fessum]